jgi:hypothetical protein
MTEVEIEKQLTAFINEWSSEERVARMFSGHEVDADKWYLLGRADAIQEILDIFEVWKSK